MKARSFAVLTQCVILFCAASALADGSLIQGALGPELAGTVQLVYVEHVDGTFTPQAAVMNQRGNVYVPHVLPVLVGSAVEFRSQDRELHDVFARGADHQVLFNQAVLPRMQIKATFSKPGVVKLTCNIHKGMLAFVPVLQNPYWAIPGKDGSWRIEGLPAGRYLVRIWGEDLDDARLAKTFPVQVTGPSQSQTVQIAASGSGLRGDRRMRT